MNGQYTNIPEEGLEITHMFHDKSGDVYTIRGEMTASGLISYVYSETSCIGRINWDTSEPERMLITDLIIFEPLDIKPWWVRLFPFLYKQPVSYKGRGIGSAMLNYIVASAHAMGISEIRGWVNGDDLEATPYLREFYRKHGFTVHDDLTFYRVLG